VRSEVLAAAGSIPLSPLRIIGVKTVIIRL
jgi:hypothetical protein